VGTGVGASQLLGGEMGRDFNLGVAPAGEGGKAGWRIRPGKRRKLSESQKGEKEKDVEEMDLLP